MMTTDHYKLTDDDKRVLGELTTKDDAGRHFTAPRPPGCTHRLSACIGSGWPPISVCICVPCRLAGRLPAPIASGLRHLRLPATRSLLRGDQPSVGPRGRRTCPAKLVSQPTE